MSQGFYSSGWATENAAAQGAGSPVSAPAKKVGAAADILADDEDQISEMAFLRWKTELQNRLIVEQEKRLADERKAFKAGEDAKFTARKQELHKRTIEEFGHAKGKGEELRQANLARGQEYQADLEEMKAKIAYQKEEWRQFGHELTVQHGTEQVERTRARIAESLETKAEAGRQVKRETDNNNKAIHSQRVTHLEEKHKHVDLLKKEKAGKLEESLQYMFDQKRSMVDEVRRVEDRWSALTKEERDSFLAHAHENHNKNDATKEQMRGSRKELMKKNHTAASEERLKKEEDAVIITKKRSEEELAKKAVRDGVYTTRFTSPEKSRLMKQAIRAKSPQKTARDSGLIMGPIPTDPASPYRMAPGRL